MRLGKSQRDKDPIKVASVAAFDPQGRLLFGRREDSAGRPYTLPGGHLNPGESPTKGAVRELLEETGLKPTELHFLGDQQVTSRDGKQIQVYAFRALVDGTPTGENDPDGECDEWRFVDVGDGLPKEIAQNLHAPKNVTLQLLGLQDTLRKSDEDPTPTKPKLQRAKKTPKPQEPNLVVLHNLSAGNLLHAHKLGGLAAPSLAIAHKDHPIEGFGEISLVGHPDLIDPKHNPTFNSDIYSPRHPRARYKINPKPLYQFQKWLQPHAKQTDTYLSDLENELGENGIQHVLNDRGLRHAMSVAYLHEKGQPLEPPMRQKRIEHEWVRQPAMQEFAAKHGIDHNFGVDSPYHDALGQAAQKGIHQHAEKIFPNEPTDQADLADSIKGGLFGDDGKMYFGRSGTVLRNLEDHDKNEIDPHAFRDMIEDKMKAHSPSDFENWARTKTHGIEGEPYIPKYSENTGNMRKIPYNLQNILKEVTSKVRQGEGFNYGLGTARAAGSKQFRNLDQIKAARHQIVPSKEFNKVKESMNDRFGRLADELAPYGGGGNMHTLDNLAEAIGESYKRGKYLHHELNRSLFKDVPPKLQQKVADFARDLVSMPTEYFESKPQRAVQLGEFKGAAVPHDVDPAVLEALKKEGIGHVEHYRKGDPNARKEAIQRIAHTQNLMLSEKEPDGALLTKGSMARLAPFNPQEALDPEDDRTIHDWQTGYNPSDDPEMNMRDAIPYMRGPARFRALHKLSAATKVRKNPLNGEREFLLHRGMSPEEHETATAAGGPGFIDHDATSSWTPRWGTAKNFAIQYTHSAVAPIVASAWVPESSIHNIPKQYGEVKGDFDNYQEGDYEKPAGPNRHGDEHEVIVSPGHKSQLAMPEELHAQTRPLTTLHGRINEAGREEQNIGSIPDNAKISFLRHRYDKAGIVGPAKEPAKKPIQSESKQLELPMVKAEVDIAKSEAEWRQRFGIKDDL